MFVNAIAPSDALISQLIPIIDQASHILRHEYEHYVAGNSFDIITKHDNSPVTQADFKVNQFITTALGHTFSNIPILSEEGEHEGRHAWEKFWLLDPLDGTKEFINQRSQFTINLSLVERGITIFAMLAIPCEHMVYICPLQGMPIKYNLKTQEWFEYQNQISHNHSIQIGLSHSKQKQSKYTDYISVLKKLNSSIVEYRAGSAYKFCMMLEDKVDLYPRFHPTSEWDTSAGQCLLERIGGGLLDFKQRPFLYNQRATLLNNGFIAYKNSSIKKLAFEALSIMPTND